MTETRKERRDRKRAEGVQRRLAAALEDAWQRISEEKRAEFIGNGTDIRVDGRYLLASTNGEVWCMIDRTNYLLSKRSVQFPITYRRDSRKPRPWGNNSPETAKDFGRT